MRGVSFATLHSKLKGSSYPSKTTRRIDRMPLIAVLVLSAGFGVGCSASEEITTEWFVSLRSNSLGPLLVLLVFVASGFVAAPLTAVMIPTILVYGPIAGGALTMVGATLAGAVFFGIGFAGGGFAKRLNLPSIERHRFAPLLERNGIVAVALARNLPIAPYSVVNLAIGSSPVKFRDFLLGNAIGLLPWVVLYSLAGDQIRGFAEDPSPGRLISAASLVLGIAALSFAAARLVSHVFPTSSNARAVAEEKGSPDEP